MYDQSNSIPMMPPANALSLPGRTASNSASMPSAANMVPNIFTNPSIQPSSVINLTSSSDVVIGPMTQYQGPVNIYQYMDATVEARAMHANGGIRQNTTNETTTVLQKATKNSTILIVILITVLVGAGIAIFYIYQSKSDNTIRPPREILFGNNYESGTIPNLGNGHLVIDRQQWGASDFANKSYILEHPIPYVLITHVGVQSVPCFNVYKCSIKMRTFQDSAIAERGLPDINSNFYVGNDGNVYVGRGWNHVNTYANKTLAITFMGDYVRSEPDAKQLEAVQFLLAYGVTQKYIALDYKLVAQNQTRKSKSPGTNVYKEIIKWPHWYPCGMNGNPKCGSELGLPTSWEASM